MIDLHCHIIYGVDDGPSKIQDSMRMILAAQKIGVNTIIATPHYKKDVYVSEVINENFQNIKSRISDFGIDLFLGREVFISSALSQVVEDSEKYTLSGTSFLLMELPFDILPLDINEMLLKLHEKKITPIVAHPERYSYFVRDFNRFLDFIEVGCLVQIDAASIVGVHGAGVKKFARKLIDLNLVHYVASDAHAPEHYIKWHKEAYQKVKNWAGEEYADAVFKNNQKTIINQISGDKLI